VLTSDDGSTLELGDHVVIDHDGYHGAEDRSGQAALAAGWHPIRIRYFQATGGKALTLRVAGPTGRAEEPATSRLSHRP
jgi:hexosaminidase